MTSAESASVEKARVEAEGLGKGRRCLLDDSRVLEIARHRMSGSPPQRRLRYAAACGLLVLALAVVWRPLDAAAAFVTGNQLLSACQSSTTLERMDCLGYVSAIADVLEGGGQIQGLKACMQPNVTRGQAKDVVVAWLIANANHRHHAASILSAAALAGAFPCAAPPERPQRPKPPPSSTNPFERR